MAGAAYDRRPTNIAAGEGGEAEVVRLWEIRGGCEEGYAGIAQAVDVEAVVEGSLYVDLHGASDRLRRGGAAARHSVCRSDRSTAVIMILREVVDCLR